jgi:hypothetical protein
VFGLGDRLKNLVRIDLLPDKRSGVKRESALSMSGKNGCGKAEIGETGVALKGMSTVRAWRLTEDQVSRRQGKCESSYYRWRALHAAEPTDASRR